MPTPAATPYGDVPNRHRAWLENGWVLAIVAALLVVETVADKIPALDWGTSQPKARGTSTTPSRRSSDRPRAASCSAPAPPPRPTR